VRAVDGCQSSETERKWVEINIGKLKERREEKGLKGSIEMKGI
jgi:hypothetical protein